MPLPFHISPLKEALAFWALSFALLFASSRLLPSPFDSLVAVLSFLLLPRLASFLFHSPDFGLHFLHWKAELRLFFLLFLPVLLLFPLLFLAWLHLLGAPFSFQPQLPPRFLEWTLHHYLVVALSEEYFYRGYLQSRFNAFWPRQTRFFRPGLLLAALLFALGHLAYFDVSRLAVFFPALLFGFAREKTQGLLCPVLLHGSCNLLLMLLQHAFVQG